MRPQPCRQAGCKNKTYSDSGYCWRHSKLRTYNRPPGEPAPRPAPRAAIPKPQSGPFKIERGIPIPAGGMKKGYAATFKQMKPGDSVLLPVQSRNNVSGSARTILGKGNYIGRKENGGMRIWFLTAAQKKQLR